MSPATPSTIVERYIPVIGKYNPAQNWLSAIESWMTEYKREHPQFGNT